MTTRLIIVRHGQTEWSRVGRHTSVTDLPLTPDGEAEARALEPMLACLGGIDRVIVSPRLRARRTADLAGFPGAEVVEDLAEWAYGDYEGITTAQIRRTVPGWSVWSHPVPGGESAEQVAERLDRVISDVRAHGGTTVAFAHGHALRALTARWLGLEVSQGRHFFLDTGTWGELSDDRGSPVIMTWNVGRHDGAGPGMGAR